MKNSILLLLPLLSACVAYLPVKTEKPILVLDRQDNTVLSYHHSYALLIGQQNYNNGWSSLNAVHDEMDTVETVLQEQGFMVEKHLDVESSQLENTYSKFIEKYGFQSHNRLLFFFSGHGYSRSNGKKGYIVPTDAPLPSQKGFLKKILSMHKIQDLAQKIKAKHALFLFDSCFSGTLFQDKSAFTELPAYITKSTALQTRQFITAGRAQEKVPAHSVFTPAFVNALRYKRGDLNGDGYVTGLELGLYLAHVVPQHSPRQHPQYGKIKDYDDAYGDFVFVLDKKNSISSPVKVVRTPIIIPHTKEEVKHLTLAIAQVTQVTQVTEDSRDEKKREEEEEKEERQRKEIARIKAQEQRLSFNIRKVFRDRLKDGSEGPQMVSIPAGSFEMGSYNDNSDETPVHTVTVDRFAIGKYEVTVGEFKKFVHDISYQTDAETGNGCYVYDSNWYKKTSAYWKNPNFSQSNTQPVVCVSWNDATAYTKWLSKQTGYTYRLPTEAEWEYAARAGTKTQYWWGDSMGNNRAACDNHGDVKRMTFPVDSFTANPWGLHDTVGNVWEWVQDWYNSSYYSSGISNNPTGPSMGQYRVRRGGSWFNNAKDVRVANRYWSSADSSFSTLGLRLVRTYP